MEKAARRALWRMVFWRLVGELCTLPQAILRIVIAAATNLGNWFRNLEMAVFYLELDAARRYKLITGLDLGTASGDPGRYGSLDPDMADRIQGSFMDSALGEDDDV